MVPMHESYATASRYLFGLSPPGVGVDCYRTWELYLLGIIPVVLERPENADLHRGLPVIQLKNWNYTQDELVETMREYVSSEEFRTADFDTGWKRLFLRYWRRRVLADTGRSILTDELGREYYQAWKYYSLRDEKSRTQEEQCAECYGRCEFCNSIVKEAANVVCNKISPRRSATQRVGRSMRSRHELCVGPGGSGVFLRAAISAARSTLQSRQRKAKLRTAARCYCGYGYS